MPLEILERHDVIPEEVFAGQSTPGLKAALAELRELARRHLGAAHEGITTLPREALPAFLPLALVRPTLDRLDALRRLRAVPNSYGAAPAMADLAGVAEPVAHCRDKAARSRTQTGRADCAAPETMRAERWRARRRS